MILMKTRIHISHVKDRLALKLFPTPRAHEQESVSSLFGGYILFTAAL